MLIQSSKAHTLESKITDIIRRFRFRLKEKLDRNYSVCKLTDTHICVASNLTQCSFRIL